MKLIKKLNKGFTLVELVVVIAVIAILSAVSVVAYTGITKKANESAALSAARQKYNEVLGLDAADGKIDKKEGTTDIPGIESYSLNSETDATGYIVKNYQSSESSLYVHFDGEKWSVTEEAVQEQAADPQNP